MEIEFLLDLAKSYLDLDFLARKKELLGRFLLVFIMEILSHQIRLLRRAYSIPELLAISRCLSRTPHLPRIISFLPHNKVRYFIFLDVDRIR